MKRNDEIKAYLRSSRKGKAAHRLERDALSDPFLYEAMEGLTQAHIDPLDGIIRLERQLDNYKKQSRKNKSWIIGLAAGIVLLIGFSVFFLWETKEQPYMPDLAQNEVAAEAKALLLLSDSSTNCEEGEKPSSNGMVSDVEEVGADEVVVGIQKQHNISGMVTDTKGNPLPGAVVLGQSGTHGQPYGTATNQKGEFTLEVKDSLESLEIAFIGMERQKIQLKEGEFLNVQLREDTTALEEVVVAGYQEVKKTAYTGSVVTLKSNTITLSDGDSIAVDAAKEVDVSNVNRYLNQAFVYPEKALKQGAFGEVYLSFEINESGTPSRIKILKGFSTACNKELIRLLAEGPKWGNTPVKKRMNFKATFKMEGNSYSLTLTALPDGEELKK